MSYPMAHYWGESGENTATFRFGTTAPDVLIGAGGTEVHYLASTSSAKNVFGLYRLDMGPRPTGPAPHFHRTMSESFFVLSGTINLYDGEQWIDAEAGDFLHVPEGAVHGFRNESGEPASMLMLFAPGVPRESFFEEISEIAADKRPMSEPEWAELYRRHDHYLA
ncbi:cupin domain-containing protein [Kitasatospora sp. NPDC086801]|uniref:cupin domain-containing protein n=1 Tax=Kitasatospora sp. NPDC086801 TaxID=3364066 RepID=UPI003821A1DD